MDAHQVGEVVDVDDRRLDAGALEPVEAVVDQGAAADLDQGLRHGGGERPHALAEAGGKDHGALRADGRCRPGEVWRTSRRSSRGLIQGGRCFSYQSGERGKNRMGEGCGRDIHAIVASA